MQHISPLMGGIIIIITPTMLPLSGQCHITAPQVVVVCLLYILTIAAFMFQHPLLFYHLISY